MIHFRQHIPNYVEGYEPFAFDAADTAALLAHPWIAAWGHDDPVARHGEVRLKPFTCYSVSDNHLMAEFDGGRWAWVLGYLSGDPVDLPAHEEHPDAAEQRHAWNRADLAAVAAVDEDRFQTWPLITATPPTPSRPSH